MPKSESSFGHWSLGLGHSHSWAGFTFVEVVLVLGILVVVFALIAPVTRQFHIGSLLDTEAEALAADLRRAQAAAVAGLFDTAHGVRVNGTPTDSWVLFRGATYTEGAAGNETHAVPSAIDITAVTLTGGGQDVIFAERRGITTQAGSVTLRSPSGQTRTVSVNAEGVVDVN